MKRRLLMVDPGGACGKALRDRLFTVGFDVDWVDAGKAALASVRLAPPDLILLDVLLTDGDGFELCRAMRRQAQMPIIILTSLARDADKVRGFEMGADDYVTRPFCIDELIARMHAVLRRMRPVVDHLVLGGIDIDFVRRLARQPDGRFHLTHREFEVLRYLAERAGLVVKRDELLREVWGYLGMPHTRSVDHAINRLRKKIEPDPHNPSFIHTVHGDGYCLSIDPLIERPSRCQGDAPCATLASEREGFRTMRESARTNG